MTVNVLHQYKYMSDCFTFVIKSVYHTDIYKSIDEMVLKVMDPTLITV